ncbi:hypothetical protein BJ878DRAFT_519263 [Calycina marina]|uniref:Uncharacterized protein n=1 Tax=Calycina marina TaxID=1763456 RepID=A0A9P7YX85_9HELO|nr:hypothetical protein BJ878DRAFT_519263 [Calycina marina]
MESIPLPSVGEGLNMLWAHQLRKEHVALLQVIQEHSKSIETLNTEHTRDRQALAEHIAQLEMKEAGSRQEMEKIIDEMAALKDIMEQFPRTQPSVASFPGVFESQDESRSLSAIAHCNPASPCTAALASILPSPHAGSLGQHSPNRSPLPVITTKPDNSQLCSTNDSDKPVPPGSGVTSSVAMYSTSDHVPPIFEPTIGGPKPMKTIGIANRSQPRSRTAIQQTPAIPRVTRSRTAPTTSRKVPGPEFPRLKQGGSASLRFYYLEADKTFQDTTIQSGRERDFVAHFIKGIREEQKRKSLVTQLVANHPAFIEAGEQTIVCEWKDLGWALKKCGFLQSGDIDETMPPPKKRRRNWIPQELIDEILMDEN